MNEEIAQKIFVFKSISSISDMFNLPKNVKNISIQLLNKICLIDKKCLLNNTIIIATIFLSTKISDIHLSLRDLCSTINRDQATFGSEIRAMENKILDHLQFDISQIDLYPLLFLRIDKGLINSNQLDNFHDDTEKEISLKKQKEIMSILADGIDVHLTIHKIFILGLESKQSPSELVDYVQEKHLGSSHLVGTLNRIEKDMVSLQDNNFTENKDYLREIKKNLTYKYDKD